MIYLLLIGLILIIAIVVLSLIIKGMSRTIANLKNKNNSLIKHIDDIIRTEQTKVQIRNKFNEVKANINNGNTDDIEQLSNIRKRQHNHPFGEPCTSKCPAHNNG